MRSHCRAHPATPAVASCSRCGDYVCELCDAGPPRPLCQRCAARGSVDWEERGDQSWGRALYDTFREALGSPHRLGARLSGTGGMASAASYGVCCALLGGVPLAVLVAALVIPVADPLTLGMRSTSLLSSAVFLVLFAVGVASLLPLVLLTWALLVLCTARLLRIEVRLDLLLRASSYGASALAIPLFGPLLAPLALLGMLLCLHGALSAVRGPGRAACCLLLALLLATAPWLLGLLGS